MINISNTIKTLEVTPQKRGAYPFTAASTFTSTNGVFIPPTFLTDARIYSPGATVPIYVSKIRVTQTNIVMTINDYLGEIGSAIFSYDNKSTVSILDQYKREVGVLIGNFDQIRTITKPNTSLEFTQAALEFITSVIIPVPIFSIKNIFAEESTIAASGEVWLIGEDGVKLETVDSDNDGTADSVRINIISDPLFKRKLCSDTLEFSTKRGLKGIIVKNENDEETVVLPDVFGNIQIVIGNGTDQNGSPIPSLVNSNIMRIFSGQNSLKFKVLGNMPNAVT